MIAHPNSKNPRVEKDMLGRIHVYVGEPARENKANKAIRNKLALHYKVPKTVVTLIYGAKDKNKVFEIEDVD